MALNALITLFLPNRQVDELGEQSSTPVEWRKMWATPTASGGSRKTYAGRLVSEHRVVLSTRWIAGIEACTEVEYEGKRRPIESIVPEGFSKKVHIIIDTGEYANY